MCLHRHDFKVNGKPWIDKLRNEDYKKEIEEFKAILTKIGERDQWMLEDLQKRFSNEMYDKLIFS
jgi:thiaminase